MLSPQPLLQHLNILPVPICAIERRKGNQTRRLIPEIPRHSVKVSAIEISQTNHHPHNQTLTQMLLTLWDWCSATTLFLRPLGIAAAALLLGTTFLLPSLDALL